MYFTGRLIAVLALLPIVAGTAAAQQTPVSKIPLTRDMAPLDGYGEKGPDVLGIRLGETRDNAIAILKKNYPDAKVEERNYVSTVSDNRNNKVSFEFKANVQVGATSAETRENITVRFTSDATGNRVWNIERVINFTQPADTETLRKAVIGKYGEPTLIERFDHQNSLEITFTWERRPVKRLGEQDVMKRPFNAPRPDTVNTCIDTAWSNPYQGASNYDWQPWPPGQRKPYPRHEQCVGGVKVTMYYASNTQTVRQMKVIANDHYRAMTDAQQLDSAVAKLMEEAVNSVQGTKQAPKL